MARAVVKLGSSIVADESGALRADVLDARLRRGRATSTPPATRSSSSPAGRSRAASRSWTCRCARRAIEDLQAASAVGQGKLYRVYDELLRARGVTSAQVLLTFFDMSARGHYLNARRTLRRLLDWRVVPVINENDTTTTDEISFGDNDFLAAQLAILIGAEQLVLLTDIDGLYTADPRTDPGARARRRGRRTSRGCDVARHRPRRRRRWARAGCARRSSPPRWPRRPGSRRRSATASSRDRAGRGARRRAAWARASRRASARYSSFKLWLRYAKPSHGTVVVDAGAARALREGGTSLLPVGIVEVRRLVRRGRRRRGRRAAAARCIGKGICNYSADELRRVARDEERRRPRGAAARDRGGRAPRLLRPGVIESPLLVRRARSSGGPAGSG